MKREVVTIAMNGVTGRMGANQHLARSLIAIRKQGGLQIGGQDRVIWPEPVLIGRNQARLAALAEPHGLRYTTTLEDCLSEPGVDVYFDSQTTSRRAPALHQAIAAGKHIYCEKPVSDSLESSLQLARAADEAGVKHGVVQDKLFLPGLLKLRRLLHAGFFGKVLSVRGEFGYWVFEGDWQPAQRPSWNYRQEDGGGIISDMFCHWQYVLSGLFGPIHSVMALGATHIPQRVDEGGRPYRATADDAAYAMFELEGGVVAQMNSSWCVRVHRGELFELQVDGTDGSAIAGLRDCRVQHRSVTPRPVWNPDVPNPFEFRADWHEVPDNRAFDNAFKVQWESFLRHVVLDEPFPHGLLEGAKGVQLAELGLQSWRERRWLDVPALEPVGA